MPKTIYLVTTNDKKLEVARAALEKYGIFVEKISIDTPEIQSETAEEVVRYSAQYAAKQSGRSVIKGDVALHIDDLGGFPGPFVKYINRWLKAEQFSKIVTQDGRAKFVDALGYCDPEGEAVCFVTETPGKMVSTSSGDNGNMVDSFFIPDGYDKTIASMTKEEYLKLWDNDRFSRLASYLNKK